MPVLSTLQRVSGEDARQFAYRILRLSILELLLRPGEKLNEQNLAASLEMSRTPVRDVLARLARENLVELIPQRGAFVSRIDAARTEQAVWAHIQTGVAALEVLYTEMVPTAAFAPLQQNVVLQEHSLAAQNILESTRLAVEFQRILYDLSGLDRVWSAMHRAGADFWRLFYLANERQACRESTLLECRCIAQALAARDNATACHALRHQYTRILGLSPVLQAQFPACFTAESCQEPLS